MKATTMKGTIASIERLDSARDGRGGARVTVNASATVRGAHGVGATTYEVAAVAMLDAPTANALRFGDKVTLTLAIGDDEVTP